MQKNGTTCELSGKFILDAATSPFEGIRISFSVILRVTHPCNEKIRSGLLFLPKVETKILLPLESVDVSTAYSDVWLLVRSDNTKTPNR